MRFCDKIRICMTFLFGFLIEGTMAEDESWLVYPNEPSKDVSEIVIRPLSQNEAIETHIPLLSELTALTYDFEEKKIYWSVLRSLAIRRANIDGTDMEIVFKRTANYGEYITGLALDWITKNIYISLEYDNKIMACDTRTRRCSVLVHDSKYRPFRIALHPQSGTMVWTNKEEPVAIFKASMDGSHPTQITAAQDYYLGSVVIDHTLSRLYWARPYMMELWTSDLNGENMSNLKSIGTTSITAIGFSLTERDIYWLDYQESCIKKCNKNDGSLLEVERAGVQLRDNRPDYFDMILMWSEGQPNRRVNHCANHSCPHVCVLTETSFRCTCPGNLTLSENGQQCYDSSPKLIISTNKGVHVLSIATRQVETISHSSFSFGLSYDFQSLKIYWSNGINGSTIFKSNLNGSGIESVVTVSGKLPITGLAYDWIARNIYYTTGKHVGVCDGSGAHCAVLLNDSTDPPLGIALFPRSGLMFWIVFRRPNTVARACMDGSSAELLDIKKGLTNSLAIDNQDSQLYQLHESEMIITADLEGKLLRTHVPTLEGQLQSTAVGADYLYWMSDTKIQRCNKYDCSRPKTVKELNWNETVFQMSLFHREGQLQDRINHCAGGLCSHICLLTQKYFRCICPTGLYLMEDDRNCSEIASQGNFRNSSKDVVSSYTPIIYKPENNNGGHFEFRGGYRHWICANGTLVDLSDLCNGTLGCRDGTDEGRFCDIPCNKINRTDDGMDCLRTPNGPQILCPQGFQSSSDGATCKDVDECLGGAPCDNHCINTIGSYECRDIPENVVGGTDPLGVALAAAIPTIVAFALIGIAIFFGAKYIQTKNILRKLTPEEVMEFLDGNVDAANAADCGADKAMLVPFRLVLQPDKIIHTTAKDAILGSGHFGIVYRGFYEGEAVAIKTFKRTVEIDEFKAVLAEAKIMAYIGDHVNVVRFIGADVSAIADRKLVLVTELSPHGDLLGYLRKIEAQKLLQKSNGLYPDSVTPAHLGRWCEEIACGMQHLESMKIIHGDLAARNVLVFKENIVKITDFGLSKQLYGNSEYMMRRQRMLPWKWCALELLTRQEFSSDSDIWAFGVTAWEIFSLGRKPYDGRMFGMGFINYLEQGNRLPKPTYATSGIYEILKECWNIDRSSRPRFVTLREFFQDESTLAGFQNHVANLMASPAEPLYTNIE